MINRALLQILPALLLTFVPVMGTVESARSADVILQKDTDTEIKRLQRLITLMNEGAISHAQVENAVSELTQNQASAHHPAVVSVLLSLLEDSNPNLRRIAATGFARIGEPAYRAIPPLIQHLTDSDPFVRASSAYALASMGQSAQSALRPLIRLLQDSEPHVRDSAIYALGRLEPFLQDEQKSRVKP
jgi:HEAT repeats